jgi:hypothetical protein
LLFFSFLLTGLTAFFSIYVGLFVYQESKFATESMMTMMIGSTGGILGGIILIILGGACRDPPEVAEPLPPKDLDLEAGTGSGTADASGIAGEEGGADAGAAAAASAAAEAARGPPSPNFSKRGRIGLRPTVAKTGQPYKPPGRKKSQFRRKRMKKRASRTGSIVSIPLALRLKDRQESGADLSYAPGRPTIDEPISQDDVETELGMC